MTSTVKHPSVPVIMYHNIGVSNPEWIWNHLVCPWQTFRDHLEWLKKMNFKAISLQELYEYKKSGHIRHSKSVVLTFDDGYLDNWVFAYPLLKRYGFKGTIFVNTDFVDPRDIIRKTLDDVWQKREPFENLETKGFLSWKEIEMMEREGVMDIQSHCMTHTSYFCSGEIIDFHHPGNNKYPWIFWNAMPDRKYLYLSERQDREIPYGAPIYKFDSSMAVRRYFEDKELTQTLVDYVGKQGRDFFKGPLWKSALLEQARAYNERGQSRGRYESDKEQIDRFEYELSESKAILEQKLGKNIDFLCWPAGAKTDKGIELSRKAGYKAFTCSGYKREGRNVFGEDASKIYRIGSGHIKVNDNIYYLGGMGLLTEIFSFNGSYLARVARKIIKLFNIFLVKAGIKR